VYLAVRSVQGADARRHTGEELREALGGEPDTATVLHVFLVDTRSMSVNQYSVLVGDPQPGSVSGPHGKPPHYLVPVNAAGSQYQIAINIESDAGDSQVLYSIQTDFQPSNAALLSALPQGMNPISTQVNPAIDYIRSRSAGKPIVTLAAMQLLPLPSEQNSQNLNNAVVELLNQATSDPDGLIYAFGGQYTDGTGIHETHMNQGNATNDHSDENGIWNDGAVLFYLPASSKWTTIFIAFQGQSWNTDNNGNPI